MDTEGLVNTLAPEMEVSFAEDSGKENLEQHEYFAEEAEDPAGELLPQANVFLAFTRFNIHKGD
ncbi:unnamed protein product [Lupinus luteus]|uniref:Uncharacterized protein n=1 Tax=Lupinus luteus TaxID=3873 RepID=A0AAV1WVH8_LUPLU